MIHQRARRFAFLLFCTLAIAACGGKRRVEAPSPETTSVPPDLSGMTVMLLPVHSGQVPGNRDAVTSLRYDGVDQLDSELAYWMAERANRVKWVMPSTMERTLARSPGLGIHIRELAVQRFRTTQLKRIGDPLYGDLRRLAAMFDARFALIPVAAEFRPNADGTGTMHVGLALIDALSRDVIWFGVVAGEPGAPASPTTAASVAQKIAGMFGRTL